MAYMSHQYVFVLGNTPELSLQELAAFFPEAESTTVSDGVAIISLPDKIDSSEIINKLGGTVKIAKITATLDLEISNEKLSEAIAEQLASLVTEDEKITFGLAEFGRNHLLALSHEKIKSLLQDKEQRARYIDSPRYGLSAAVLNNHPKVKEVLVIKAEDQTFLALTEATQDIELWTTKDRGKPYSSRKKGMLPPKVARIMVNLALGNQLHVGKTLLDPFCGSGTVLIEAAESEISLVGSDTDPESVEGTRQNLEWWNEHLTSATPFKVYQADATQLQLPEKVDFIVTEPFLGKPKPPAEKIPNIFKGLEKLYLGAFKHWRNLLVEDATIVIVFPRALAATAGIKRDETLDKLIDKLALLGYTSILKPVIYHRPQAVIGREIHIFKYNSAK